MPISPAGPCRRRTRASSAILIGRTEPIVPYGTGRNRPRLLAGVHLRALTLTIRVRETCFSRPVVVLSGKTQICVSAFGLFSACMYVCVCVRVLLPWRGLADTLRVSELPHLCTRAVKIFLLFIVVFPSRSLRVYCVTGVSVTTLLMLCVSKFRRKHPSAAGYYCW